MKRIPVFFFILILTTLSGCNKTATKKHSIPELIKSGEFAKAETVLKKLIKKDSTIRKYQIQLETIKRLQKEFTLTEDDITRQLVKYYPNLSDSDLIRWEEAGQLEMRIIDREKRYFHRAVGNFFRLNPEAKKLKESLDGKEYSGGTEFRETVIPGYFKSGIKKAVTFDSHKMKVNYTVTLNPNAVPEGEVVKCWLPYPRVSSGRLTKVEFLDANNEELIIAPEETMQRTVYMEKPAVKDSATVFNVSYIIHTAARWFGVTPNMVKPYDKSGDIYIKYTAERLPHIVLSDEVKHLAKEIVGDETNPGKQVHKLFYWIDHNIPWAGALEYSVIESIPQYVLENRHGDCGMQTFLFLSLARSLGIPCKWQSGWYLFPQTKNLHDWAEVYYEGVGWVPVDQSFGLINSDDVRVKEFYIHGMDSYRLIINDDYNRELYPPKKYYRSEPYDFQRGELEWSGGNLYFDTWTYNMEVEYLQ
ncbi:MAG: transglutaminase-like domain-containing protein [Bacteroidota bacterium]